MSMMTPHTPCQIGSAQDRHGRHGRHNPRQMGVFGQGRIVTPIVTPSSRTAQWTRSVAVGDERTRR